MSRATLPSRVTVVEVGPRDGLQNEAAQVPDRRQDRVCERAGGRGAAGRRDRGVRQSGARAADGRRRPTSLAASTRRPGVRYSALVPNLRGLAAAHEAGLTEVAIFAAASETFSQRNINQTIEASLDGLRGRDARRRRRSGMRVRGYLSTAFGCPFEGAVPLARVVELTERLLAMGVFEVAVSDTIGVATPGQVVDMVEALAARVPRRRWRCTCTTRAGTALANVYAALEAGITTFDASAGGLGGCPFAPGAAGNLATEDLLYMLHGLGIETGVDLDAVVARLAARSRPDSTHRCRLATCRRSARRVP